ncbi:alpha/beta hydrolase family esterase [Corynebacterium alimapuense]|uniref:alpha/beta hydrolase family esterase n=1 Tax=Corynebacterium alimapuense TaxID=1576874 RepID=UPI001FEC0AED|nr:dienelactone hydrolase family protein [Corynebacterium alimapuense]
MREPEKHSFERVTLRHRGRNRTFNVITPKDLPENPGVLFYFHGSLQTGNVARNFTGHTFDDMAARAGIVLVYPDGVDRHFNDSRRLLHEKTRDLGIDDVGFTREMISWLIEQRSIDSTRVFACGYSNGGQMVIRLLHDAPGMLAGAATFAATMPTPDNLAPEIGDADVATPYLAIHGTGDHIVKYEGGEAGLDRAHSRGLLVSAMDSAEYFANCNGLSQADHTVDDSQEGVTVDTWAQEGKPSVQLWSIEGMGHVVPAHIGPGTTTIVAADVVAGFFGW